MRRAEVAAVAKGKATRPAQAVSVLGLLAVAGWDDKTILIIGDRQIAMHFFDLCNAETGLREHLLAIFLTELTLSVVGAHGQHALQCRDDGELSTSRQPVRQIADGDAQRAHIW